MPYACATLPCTCFQQVPDPNPAFRSTYIQYNFKTMTLDEICPPTFDRLRPLSVEAHTIGYVVFLLQSIDTNRTMCKQDAARLCCRWHLVQECYAVLLTHWHTQSAVRRSEPSMSFPFNSSLLSVDGMTCLILFES